MSMSHLMRDLTQLRQEILKMGGLVEAALRDATQALVRQTPSVARRVLQNDAAIDSLELAIDDACLKILALHQPVARDLRFITATMKINNDLERIGDLASNLAQRALDLMDKPTFDRPLEFERMTEVAGQMLHASLDALVEGDCVAARRVLSQDDLLDAMNRRHFDVIEARMVEEPRLVSTGVLSLSASRNLERVGDLATNIAEDVIFLVEAQDIRHWPLGRIDALLDERSA
jgi:phosphate transport system protein